MPNVKYKIEFQYKSPNQHGHRMNLKTSLLN